MDETTASRVLVVEDDETVTAGLAGRLAGDGHEVRWARTGADARREVATAPPDLVLLDVGLPDAEGIELCVEFRSQLPEQSSS